MTVHVPPKPHGDLSLVLAEYPAGDSEFSHVKQLPMMISQNQRQRILEVLSQQDHMIPVSEIANLTDIDSKTCGTRLSEMYMDMIVDRPIRGYYSLRHNSSSENPPTGWDITVGGVVLPRVQNLRMGVDVVVGASDVVVLVCGGVKIELRFGGKRGHLDCCVSCDLGLDPVAFGLVVDRVNELCADRGYYDLDWCVTSFEWLTDFYGLRLDGLSCITLRDFIGDFSKVYQKPWGVRRESRWSDGEISLSGVWELLRGDVREYNYRTEVERLATEVERLTVAQKYSNRELGEIRRGLGEILKVIEPRDGLQGEEG